MNKVTPNLKFIEKAILPLIFQSLIFIAILYIFVVFKEHTAFAYTTTFLIFLTFLYTLYRKERAFFITAFYLIFAVTAALAISIFLEYGAYLFEMQVTTFAIGLPQKITIQLMLFLLGAFISFTIFKKSRFKIINFSVRSNQLILYLGRIFVICAIFILLYIAFKFGTPNTHNLHRHDYWAYTDAPLWGRTLAYFLMQFTFLLGLGFAKLKKRFDIILFIATFATVVLMGERLTGLIYMMLYFFTPILVLSNKGIKSSTIITISFLFLLILLSILSSTYENNKVKHILNRSAVQAQMWWGLEQQSHFHPQDGEIILNKFVGLEENNRESGIYYLMDQVADSKIVDARYKNDSRFTLGGFINHIFFFGYGLGSLANLFIGGMFGIILFLFYLGITQHNFFYALISFKFFYKVLGLTLTGSSTDFFSLNTLIYLIIISLFLSYSNSSTNTN